MYSAGPLNSVTTNLSDPVRLMVRMTVLKESRWEIIYSTIWSRCYEPLRIFRNAAFSAHNPAPPPIIIIVSSTEQLRIWNIRMANTTFPLHINFLSICVKGIHLLNVTSSMSTALALTEPSVHLNPFLRDYTKSALFVYEGRRHICCSEYNFYKTEWDMKEFWLSVRDPAGVFTTTLPCFSCSITPSITLSLIHFDSIYKVANQFSTKNVRILRQGYGDVYCSKSNVAVLLN
jgi:hypothetical protein